MTIRRLALETTDRLLQQAEQAARAGQRAKAESLCERVLEQEAGQAQASLMAARLATERRDLPRAVTVLRLALERRPGQSELAVQLALALAAGGDLAGARDTLQRLLELDPGDPPAWLILSLVEQRLGDDAGALKAAHQAVTRAQRAGHWLDESSTPPDLLAPVVQAMERVRRGRRELFFGSFAELRAEHGADALKRMDRALSGYLKDLDITPPDAQQRPKFFYFPGLPDLPYHDPALHPWAARLEEAYPEIRAEALAVIREDQAALPDFIPPQAAQVPGQYLGGESAHPAWQAYFFYRHGKRYADNHLRCPNTSRVLESIDLCRIADQAPEICFSVLRPQTHIKPHHGVTNTRLVMHLPLIVPPDCALNLVDRGLHKWQEGKLVMFDDTFLHESWNRSTATRVIVLMDCWNPHLTAVERLACTRLIEMISSLKPKPPVAA